MSNLPPVVLKIEGGLGNQLFQMAAGFYVAAKLDLDLLIDQYAIPLTTVHGETGSGYTPFEPLVLPNSRVVELLPALPNKVMTALAKKSTFVKRLLLKWRLFTSNPRKLELFIETNEFRSTCDLLNVSKPIKLHGNFQSWEIVERAAQYGFPRKFRLRNIPLWVLEMEKSIDFKNSFVLHFRVGDDTRINANFRQPEIDYYLEALKFMRSRKSYGGTYILSDDIPRVKEMFGDKFGADCHFLEMPRESSPAERLYILSLFGGIVCANSTFCGWAAWSIFNSGGEVIVPVPYSDGPVLGSRDFPSRWHKLDKYSGKIVT